MTKNKTILSQNWSFRAKNWPKIAKKKLAKNRAKIGQKMSLKFNFKTARDNYELETSWG